MKKIFLCSAAAALLAGCSGPKSQDLFADPDNDRIAAYDSLSVFHVPVKQITFGPKYHWFAYYDKQECDPTGRYVLSMQTDFQHRSPTGDDVIKIGMVDLEDGCKWIELGKSEAWGWQQGCQLQFIPGTDSKVLWNDKEGDNFVCRIMDIETREMRTIPRAVYALSTDGKWAVTTDYRRVNDTRPGYGYAGIPDPNRDVLAPEDSGIWRINLETGESELIISLAQIAAIPNPLDDYSEAKHWFNHLLYNTDGSRFEFLHRWRFPDSLRNAQYEDVGGFGTQMLTASAEGKDVRIIDPYNYTSHFIWKDAEHILAWTKLPETGFGFYLFRDSETPDIRQIGKEQMPLNGHCTYLPAPYNDWILNDTYPDENRMQSVYLFHEPTGRRVPIAELYSPEAFQGEWRCDTHPRSTQDGRRVIMDGPMSGGRQLYIFDIGSILDAE